MSQLLNQPAPDFSLMISGGGRFTLSDIRKQVVVLNFWAAECPWSRRADLVLVYRQASWERQGVHVVGIASNANEPQSEIHYEAEVRRVGYPILLDPGQDVARLYGAEVTPHFVVIDSRGIIRYVGALDDASAEKRLPTTIYLDKAVEAVLANRAPKPSSTKPYGSAIVRRPGSGPLG